MQVKRYNVYYGETEIIGEFRETETHMGTELQMEIYKGHTVPIGIRVGLGDINTQYGIMNDNNVRSFISERVVPETRVNIQKILKSIGMKEYSAYGIFKYNNGRNFMDGAWVDFEHEK